MICETYTLRGKINKKKSLSSKEASEIDMEVLDEAAIEVTGGLGGNFGKALNPIESTIIFEKVDQYNTKGESP